MKNFFFFEIVYSVKDIWKQMFKKPLRPDIRRYEIREIIDHSHREQIRFDAKVDEARAIVMTPYLNIKEV